MIKNKKGETLIEVVLGLAILAAVLVSAYILTNQATRINQQAIERTEVSNLMRQQVELLTGLRQEFKTTGSNAAWQNIFSTSPLRIADGAAASYSGSCNNSPVGGSVANPSSSLSSYAFIIDPRSGSFGVKDAFNASGTPAADFFGNGSKYSIWIEAYGSSVAATPSTLAGYTDFHITACWERIGGGQVEKSGIVTRFAQ